MEKETITEALGITDERGKEMITVMKGLFDDKKDSDSIKITDIMEKFWKAFKKKNERMYAMYMLGRFIEQRENPIAQIFSMMKG
jgi:hypothetical protein